MRRLLYVPIIHTEADLGSLAADMDRLSASACGEERWGKHKEVVSQFWKAIEGYLASLDGANLKIYQDGLAAEGDLGRKIVVEGARRGSVNYQILLHLLNQGAEVRKTEDVSLLAEEYRQAVSLMARRSSRRKLPDYELRKRHLTEQRDRFIAKRINESLGERETGILFIGAHHDVLPHLASDIEVKALKEPAQVRAYFEELLAGRNEERLEQLGRYLASPIEH